MRMRRKCFGNLPFPTEACQEVYPYPPKLFWKFMVTFRGKPAKVWACAESVSVIYCSTPTEIVSAIYPDLPGHAGKGMGMHRKCFGNVSFPTRALGVSIPTEIVLAIYGDLLRQASKAFKNISELHGYPPQCPLECMSTL